MSQKVTVEMLVNTFFQKPLKKGDQVEVTQEVAERWERNGIAKIAKTAKDPRREELENMKVAELKEYAEANGIELPEETKKAEIIEAILAAKAGGSNDAE